MLVPSSIAMRRRARQDASVLLEVVLALTLFVGAATVITTGINASIQAVQRIRYQTHAVNLAISVMSELQMHLRPLTAIGPENFDAPFEDWQYRIVVGQAGESAETTMEPGDVQLVEVVVSHTRENITHRISQLVRASSLASDTLDLDSAPPGAPGIPTPANPIGGTP